MFEEAHQKKIGKGEDWDKVKNTFASETWSLSGHLWADQS